MEIVECGLRNAECGMPPPSPLWGEGEGSVNVSR